MQGPSAIPSRGQSAGITRADLRAWLRLWEKLLDEPAEVLLARSCVTLIEAANLEFVNMHEQGKVKSSWMNKLLGWLQDHLSQTSYEVELLEAEHRALITRLRSELRRNPRRLSDVYSILQQLRDAPSESLLRVRLEQELTRPQVDAIRLRAVTALIIRCHLPRHDREELKRLPERTLSSALYRSLLQAHLPGLLNPSNPTYSLLADWFLGLLEEESLVLAFEAIQREADSLLDVFNLSNWPGYAFRLLAELPREWAGVIRSSAIEHTTSNDQDNPTIHLKVGRIVIERYIETFLRQVIVHLADHSTKENMPEARAVHRELSRFIDQSIDSEGETELVEMNEGAPEAEADDQDDAPSVSNSLTLITFIHSWARIVAPWASSRLWTENWAARAIDIGRLVSSLLDPDGVGSRSVWVGTANDELRRRSVDWAAQRTVHRALLVALNQFHDEVLNRVGELKFQLAGELPEHLRDVGALLWEQWIRSISNWNSRVGHPAAYLPWDEATGTEVTVAFDALFEALRAAPDEWFVTFEVKGVNSQGTVWSAGPVTFYDPSQYAYVESQEFQARDWANESVTFARVQIQAETFEQAQQVGLLRVNQALSALSFAKSVGGRVGGFRPEIGNTTYAYKPADGRWKRGGKLSPTQLAMPQSAIENRLQQFAKSYEPLLARSEREDLNQLQRAFLTGMSWYVKGRWTADPTERLLFYWIGLEALFPDDKLINELPRLGITWHDLPGAVFLGLTRSEIVRQIEANPAVAVLVETETELRGWNRDYRVLLRPRAARLLEELLRASHTEFSAYCGTHATELERLQSHETGVELHLQARRDALQFKLQMIASRRHAIVHKGLAFRPDMSIYADEIEDILEDVLKKMVNDAVAETPACHTVSDVITLWTTKPWNED